MAPEKFRRQLRQEAEHWRSEGLIDSAFYETLAQRYQFQRLEQDASNRFIAILLGLGAILLGLGAITFVAANWQVWSRTFKVVLLLSCFVGVNVAGFALWQQPLQSGWRRLGQGFLLLGGLLLGANMALMSQMFHQSGQSYELFLIWGFGVALMAYGLRFVPLGVLALILVTIGYCFGWPQLSWNYGMLWQEFFGVDNLVHHLPVILCLVFVPLAYWCRSRVILGFSGLLIAISFVFNLRPLSFWYEIPWTGWWVAIAFCIPPALLWSYQDPGQRPSAHPATTTHSRSSRWRSLSQPFFSHLSLWFLVISFYVFSFKGLWNPSRWDNSAIWSAQSLLDGIVLGAIAALGWIRIGNPFQLRYWRERYIDTFAIALSLIVSALLWSWGPSAGIYAILGFNLLLFGFAIGLIRDGLALGLRATFWWGMAVLVIGITSRMLEYNTGLIWKAIVFAVCGVGIILAGLNFERTLRGRSLAAVAPSSRTDTP